MGRVRLSVDVEPELKRRVRIAAARRDLSVKEWVEEALSRALAEESRKRPDEAEEDAAWLEGDLSGISEVEPYEWSEGELDEGTSPEEALKDQRAS